MTIVHIKENKKEKIIKMDDVIYVTSSSEEGEFLKEYNKCNYIKPLIKEAVLFSDKLKFTENVEFPLDAMKKMIEVARKCLNKMDRNFIACSLIWDKLLHYLYLAKSFHDIYWDICSNEYTFEMVYLMADYIVFSCNEITNRMLSSDDLEKEQQKLFQTLGVHLNFKQDSTYNMILTLIKIETKKKHAAILLKMYESVLNDRTLPKKIHCNQGFVALLLCYKKWKCLVNSEEEKLRIDEIAENILPEKLPPVQHEAFHKILPDIPVSKKAKSTRFLLVNKMMDVDEVCEHFFRVQDSILRTVAAIYLPEDEDLRTEDFANMSLTNELSISTPIENSIETDVVLSPLLEISLPTPTPAPIIIEISDGENEIPIEPVIPDIPVIKPKIKRTKKSRRRAANGFVELEVETNSEDELNPDVQSNRKVKQLVPLKQRPLGLSLSEEYDSDASEVRQYSLQLAIRTRRLLPKRKSADGKRAPVLFGEVSSTTNVDTTSTASTLITVPIAEPSTSVNAGLLVDSSNISSVNQGREVGRGRLVSILKPNAVAASRVMAVRPLNSKTTESSSHIQPTPSTSNNFENLASASNNQQTSQNLKNDTSNESSSTGRELCLNPDEVLSQIENIRIGNSDAENLPLISTNDKALYSPLSILHHKEIVDNLNHVPMQIINIDDRLTPNDQDVIEKIPAAEEVIVDDLNFRKSGKDAVYINKRKLISASSSAEEPVAKSIKTDETVEVSNNENQEELNKSLLSETEVDNNNVEICRESSSLIETVQTMTLDSKLDEIKMCLTEMTNSDIDKRNNESVDVSPIKEDINIQIDDVLIENIQSEQSISPLTINENPILSENCFEISECVDFVLTNNAVEIPETQQNENPLNDIASEQNIEEPFQTNECSSEILIEQPMLDDFIIDKEPLEIIPSSQTEECIVNEEIEEIEVSETQNIENSTETLVKSQVEIPATQEADEEQTPWFDNETCVSAYEEIEIPNTQDIESECSNISLIETAVTIDENQNQSLQQAEPEGLFDEVCDVINQSNVLIITEELDLPITPVVVAANCENKLEEEIDAPILNETPADSTDDECFDFNKTNVLMQLSLPNDCSQGSTASDSTNRSRVRALREQARIVYPMESDEDVPEVDLLKELSDKLTNNETKDGQLHYMRFLGLLNKKSMQIMLYEDPAVFLEKCISKILKETEENQLKIITPFMIKDILPEIDTNTIIDFSNALTSTPKRKGRKPKKFEQNKTTPPPISTSETIPKIIKSAMKPSLNSVTKKVSFVSEVRVYFPDKSMQIETIPDMPIVTKPKKKIKEKYPSTSCNDDMPRSSDDSDELIIDEREKKGKRPKAKVIKEKPLKGKRLKELALINKAVKISPPVISFADDGIKINGKHIDTEILRKDLIHESIESSTSATNSIELINDICINILQENESVELGDAVQNVLVEEMLEKESVQLEDVQSIPIEKVLEEESVDLEVAVQSIPIETVLDEEPVELEDAIQSIPIEKILEEESVVLEDTVQSIPIEKVLEEEHVELEDSVQSISIDRVLEEESVECEDTVQSIPIKKVLAEKPVELEDATQTIPIEKVPCVQLKLVDIDTLLEKNCAQSNDLNIPENRPSSPKNFMEQTTNHLNEYISKLESLPGIVLTKFKYPVNFSDNHEDSDNYPEEISPDPPPELLTVTPDITITDESYSSIEDSSSSPSKANKTILKSVMAMDHKILKKLNKILKYTLNTKTVPILNPAINWIVEQNILLKFNSVLQPVGASNDACVFSILNNLKRENSQATIYGFNQIQFTFMFRCILGYNVSQCTHPKPLDELMVNLEPLLHSNIITDQDMDKLERQFETCKLLNSDFRAFYLTVELSKFMKIWKFMRKFWSKSGPKSKKDIESAEKIRSVYGFYDTNDPMNKSSILNLHATQLAIPPTSDQSDLVETPIDLSKAPSDVIESNDTANDITQDVVDQQNSDKETANSLEEVETIQDNSEVEMVQDNCGGEMVQDNIEVETIQDNIEVETIQDNSESEMVQDNSEVESIQDYSEVETIQDNIEVETIQDNSEGEMVQDNIEVETIQHNSKVETIQHNSEVETAEDLTEVVEELQNSEVNTLNQDTSEEIVIQSVALPEAEPLATEHIPLISPSSIDDNPHERSLPLKKRRQSKEYYKENQEKEALRTEQLHTDFRSRKFSLNLTKCEQTIDNTTLIQSNNKLEDLVQCENSNPDLIKEPESNVEINYDSEDNCSQLSSDSSTYGSSMGDEKSNSDFDNISELSDDKADEMNADEIPSPKFESQLENSDIYSMPTLNSTLDEEPALKKQKILLDEFYIDDPRPQKEETPKENPDIASSMENTENILQDENDEACYQIEETPKENPDLASKIEFKENSQLNENDETCSQIEETSKVISNLASNIEFTENIQLDENDETCSQIEETPKENPDLARKMEFTENIQQDENHDPQIEVTPKENPNLASKMEFIENIQQNENDGKSDPITSKLHSSKENFDLASKMEFTENIQQNENDSKVDPIKSKSASLMQVLDSIDILDPFFDEPPSCNEETAPHEATNLEIESLIDSAIKDIAFWSDVEIPNDQDNNSSLSQSFPNEYQNKERNCMISGSSQDDVLPEGSFGVSDALSGLIENDMVVLVHNNSFSGYNKNVNMDTICGNPALWRKNFNQNENSFNLGGEETAVLPALDSSFGLDESSRQSNDNNNVEQVHIDYQNKDNFNRPAEPASLLPILPQLSLQQELFNKIPSPIKVVGSSPDANNLVEYAPDITEQDMPKNIHEASITENSSSQFDCIEVHGNNGNSLEVAQKGNTLSTINYDDFKIADNNFSPSQRSITEEIHTPSYYIKSGLDKTADSSDKTKTNALTNNMELSQSKCKTNMITSYVTPVRSKSSPVAMSKHVAPKARGPPVYTISQDSCQPVTSPIYITENTTSSNEKIKTAVEHTSVKRRQSLNMPTLNSDDEISCKYTKQNSNSFTKHRHEQDSLETISEKSKMSMFLDQHLSYNFEENIDRGKLANEAPLRSLQARKPYNSAPSPRSRYVLADATASLPTPHNYDLSACSSPNLRPINSSKACTSTTNDAFNQAFDKLKASSPDCLPLAKPNKIKILNVEYLSSASQTKHSNADKCQRWLNDKDCNPETHRSYSSNSKRSAPYPISNSEKKIKDPAKSTLGMINFIPKTSTKPVSSHPMPYSKRTQEMIEKTQFDNFNKHINKGSSSAHSSYRPLTSQSTNSSDKLKRKHTTLNPNDTLTNIVKPPVSSQYKKKPVYTKLLDPFNLADSNVKMGSNWSHERSNLNLEAVLEDLGTLKKGK